MVFAILDTSKGGTMKKLDLIGKIYDADVAVKVATQLQASDPDWKYVADINGKFGRVKVYDENETYLGVY
jgi:hypothetical protein